MSQSHRKMAQVSIINACTELHAPQWHYGVSQVRNSPHRKHNGIFRSTKSRWRWRKSLRQAIKTTDAVSAAACRRNCSADCAVRCVALRYAWFSIFITVFRKDPWRKSRNAPHRTAIYAADSSRLQDRSSGVQCNSEFTRRKSQGLKNPFCVQEDELLWAADELLTEEGQTHPVVLSHNYLNVTRLRAVADPWEAVGAIAPPEWSLKSFFGNQFSQYVVIFLFQGLQEILPQLQIYHPGLLMCLCIAQFAAFALTNQPTMTLIAYLYLYTMWGGSYKHYVGLIWRYGHMMSGGPTPKRLRQSILKFSRSTPAG